MDGNEFSPQVPLGGRSVAWGENEVQDWICQRVDTRKII
ncbi:AlpA family phage regulatory protein [Vibrio scophthalmi]|nr:AlpA family phage regulatory protein [Vibrio scophthalmi]